MHLKEIKSPHKNTNLLLLLLIIIIINYHYYVTKYFFKKLLLYIKVFPVIIFAVIVMIKILNGRLYRSEYLCV